MPAWFRQIAQQKCFSQAGAADALTECSMLLKTMPGSLCLSCVLTVVYASLSVSSNFGYCYTLTIGFNNNVMFSLILVHCQLWSRGCVVVNGSPLLFWVQIHHFISTWDLRPSKGKVTEWFTCPVFFNRNGNTRSPLKLFLKNHLDRNEVINSHNGFCTQKSQLLPP